MSVSKRKRDDASEIEVDLEAPEPPSKKALRRAKKGKPEEPKKDDSDIEQSSEPKVRSSQPDSNAARRDAPGIWIGNLPWTVTKDDLLNFFTTHSEGAISVTAITRVNMPGPTAASLAAPGSKHKKPVNRGFAHVDFDSTEARDAALKLSESLLAGRAVLIKDSKSFAGRPDPVVKMQEAAGKPPSTKIFIGNLGFETTEDELREHFSKCGQVKNAFMAKFHDSGKCKGYAWITFEELVSAEKAMRGWVELEPEYSGDEGSESNEVDQGDESDPEQATKAVKLRAKRKKSKPRKWYINRLKGRDLRMEYAEDATTRYIKRFGKGKQDRVPGAANEIVPPDEETSQPVPAKYQHRVDSKQDLGSHDRKGGEKPDRHDTRAATISKPAQSKDMAYLTGAVMEGKGKKITFD